MTTPNTPTATTPTTTTPGKTPTTGGGTQPEPILLGTEAASTYNPYGYPASSFGEAALAIDGDTTTAWTARVEPSVAPRMAEGLAIDLASAHRLGSIEVHTTTPGIVVEVFGATGHALPPTITAPAWTKLSAAHTLRAKTKLKLRAGVKGVRFVVVWITQAPATAVGTPQAPGHVALNEIALFPPAS